MVFWGDGRVIDTLCASNRYQVKHFVYVCLPDRCGCWSVRLTGCLLSPFSRGLRVGEMRRVLPPILFWASRPGRLHAPPRQLTRYGPGDSPVDSLGARPFPLFFAFAAGGGGWRVGFIGAATQAHQRQRGTMLCLHDVTCVLHTVHVQILLDIE